jgi:hypothetical protein
MIGAVGAPGEDIDQALDAVSPAGGPIDAGHSVWSKNALGWPRRLRCP